MADNNIAEVCEDTGGHDTGGVITGMDKMFRDKVTMVEGKKKAPKNVLTRMEALGQSAGPFSILQRGVTERLKVKVWTRNYRHIHGICTGYVVAYDKHMNLVLQDVDELYKNPARDETEFKVKKKRIRKKKIKNINRTDTVSDVKSKTVDSKDRVICNENKLESATPSVGEHPLTCSPRSLDVSSQQSAVCVPLLTETPVGGDKCVDDDDDDEQIKNLLRQVNEITQQLRDLSSSSDDNDDDDDENNSELDELSKERSRSRNTNDSDIVDASRDSETPDLCKHWSSRTRRPREAYDSPARLRDTNACRNSSHGDRAGRSSRDGDEKTHPTKERYKNIKLDQKYEDRNIDALSSNNERRSIKNVKGLNKDTSTSIDDDNINRREREDIRASRRQRGESLHSEMMPGIINSDLRRVNESLLTRHVNQLLVRGDNVVMIAIVTS